MPLGPDILGYGAAILSAVSFVPQVVKVLKTGGTEDLSLGMFACTALALAMWCAYGVWIGAVPLAVANGLTTALASIILVIKIATTGAVDDAGSGGSTACPRLPAPGRVSPRSVCATRQICAGRRTTRGLPGSSVCP